MSRKNAWKKRVYELLSERAMSSTEISHKLKETHRYNPHARKITLVLRADKEKFRELDRVAVESWTRRESHQVVLWGRIDKTYENQYPYRSVD
tara:strand:+ start:7537 stop:7815 length:279 start_codon:yes stop_codon:yes gene_type:complete